MPSSVEIIFDLPIYSSDSVSKAAHAFTGKSYVQLDAISSSQIKVTLTPKSASTDIEVLRGEFLNCALDFSLRSKLEEKTEGIRHLILAHALSKTDLLHPESDLSDGQSNAST